MYFISMLAILREVNFAVNFILFEKLLMCANGVDTAAVDNENTVGILNT